jgi:hypothetical protein
MMTVLILAHFFYANECCHEQHCHPCRAPRSSISATAGSGTTTTSPDHAAGLTGWRVPRLHVDAAAVHLSAISGLGGPCHDAAGVRRIAKPMLLTDELAQIRTRWSDSKPVNGIQMNDHGIAHPRGILVRHGQADATSNAACDDGSIPVAKKLKPPRPQRPSPDCRVLRNSSRLPPITKETLMPNPPREVPRLCRGGSKSLTFPEVATDETPTS